MSDRNDTCERCGNQSYYEGHEDWCVAISELEERIEALEKQIYNDDEILVNHLEYLEGV